MKPIRVSIIAALLAGSAGLLFWPLSAGIRA
jgi:hypothetical protein